VINHFLASQLGKPNRLFGKGLAPLWNQRNSVLNDTVFEAYEASDIHRMLEAVGFQKIQITKASDKHLDFMLVSGIKITSV
jgi:hypothetical protein